MKRVGLISCAAQKLDHAAPAKDLYVSDLFRKAYEYATREYDEVFILSAEHGLLHPDLMIEPYNVTLNNMSAAEREDWSEMVATAIRGKYGLQKVEFFIHAGEHYRKYLIPMLGGYTCHVPLKGLGIGLQKAWYKERLA